MAENVDQTAATILLEISGVDSLITINFERQFAFDDLQIITTTMSDDNLLVQFDLNEVSDTNGYNTFDISATSGATFGVLFSATTDVELLVDISISSTSTTAVGLISEGA